jgi:Flp pilus assembly pilin Flp
MKSARALYRSFLCDETGAVAIEYVLIAAGIAVALIGTLTLFGGDVNGLLGSASTTVNSSLVNAGESL